MESSKTRSSSPSACVFLYSSTACSLKTLSKFCRYRRWCHGKRITGYRIVNSKIRILVQCHKPAIITLILLNCICILSKICYPNTGWSFLDLLLYDHSRRIKRYWTAGIKWLSVLKIHLPHLLCYIRRYSLRTESPDPSIKTSRENSSETITDGAEYNPQYTQG